MNWNSNYRHKLLGKLIKSGDELLFVFDLNSAEIYQRAIKDDGKVKTSRTATFPEEWKDQFGLPVEEHKSNIQVKSLLSGTASWVMVIYLFCIPALCAITI